MKVYLITGFLGAGKTTFLNHLLAAPPEKGKIAVVVNDFGEIAVDGALIEGKGRLVRELASGCICCTLQGSLQSTLVSLEEEWHVDQVWIELAGIGLPREVVEMLFRANPPQSVASVVCLVDGSGFLRYEPQLELLRNQVQQSDIVILNKRDLVSKDYLEKTRHRLRELMPVGALLLESVHARVSPEQILEENPLEKNFSGPHGHSRFQTLYLQKQTRFSFRRLQECLQSLPQDVLRVKGFIQTDRGDKLVQWTPTHCDINDWKLPLRETNLVFIFSSSDPEELQEKLEDTLYT